MIISAMTFTILNILVKSIDRFSVYQIVFFRSIGSLLFTMPMVLKRGLPILGNKKKLLIARSIVGLLSMIFFFKALKEISVGTAVTLRYIAPIFAALFAIVFLKEKIKIQQWLYFILAFTGVLIIKGFDNSINYQGFIFAILSAVSVGLVFVIIRKIGEADSSFVIVNHYMLLATCIGGILALKHWQNPIGKEWFILIGLGLFGFFGQYYMTKSFQIGKTVMVAPLKYLEVVFTIFLGIMLLHESYNIIHILGVLLIIGSLIMNLLTKENKH